MSHASPPAGAYPNADTAHYPAARPVQYPNADRDRKILADPEALASTQLRLARETRGAVVFIAWIVGIFAVLALIGGVYSYVQIVHIENAVTQASCTAGLVC